MSPDQDELGGSQQTHRQSTVTSVPVDGDAPQRRWVAALCIAIVVAFFLPWAQIVFGSVSGLDLVRLGSYGELALLPLLLAVACLFMAGVGGPYRFIGIMTALVPLGGCIYLNVRASELPFGLGGAFWQVLGPGAWLMLASAVCLLLLLGLMPTGGAELGGDLVQSEQASVVADAANPVHGLQDQHLAPVNRPASRPAPAIDSTTVMASPRTTATPPWPLGDQTEPVMRSTPGGLNGTGVVAVCLVVFAAMGAAGWALHTEAARREASLLGPVNTIATRLR